MNEPIISTELPTELIDGVLFHRANKARNAFADAQRSAIMRFCEEVERQAEANMLKTGKLEGAHYAAMRKLRSELTAKGEG